MSDTNPFTSPADPTSSSSRPAPPHSPKRNDSLDPQLPDEPPPAYTPSAGHQGDTQLDAGPSRVDFSGPPPMPDRLAAPQAQHTGASLGPMDANITGVGVGYGRRPDHDLGMQHTGWSNMDLGPNYGPTGHPAGSPYAPRPAQPPPAASRPAPPPQHPSRLDSYSSSPTSPGGPSRPSHSTQQTENTPTEAPTPGRPLLNKGQLLIYPKGYWCNKCNNTGYKANDPSNPCSSDWRKYGKQYNSALAHSYTLSTRPSPDQNPTTVEATNFQRPLPALGPPHNNSYSQPAPQNHINHNGPSQYGHLPPPPGQHPPPNNWNGYHNGPPPGPHGPMMHPQGWGPPPPQPLVVQAGDPRIGGRLCWRCGGSGRETSFFGFDDGRCWDCGGIGRIF